MIIIVIAFVFLISAAILPINAETYDVITQSNSSNPECEIDNSCIFPNELFIQIGDHVITKSEFMNTGQYRLGCANGMSPFITFEEHDGKNIRMWEWTFTEKGTYTFNCMAQPWIKFTVYVGDTRVDTSESVEQDRDEKELEDKISAEIRAAEIAEEYNKPENIIQRYTLQLEQKDKEIMDLQKTIEEKDDTILDLKFENRDLKKQIENLDAIIMEQIKVIMEWIRGN